MSKQQELFIRFDKVRRALNNKKEVRLTSIHPSVEIPPEVFDILFIDNEYYAQLLTHTWKIEEHHRFIIKEVV